jgi:hypothetical protein
VRNTDEHFMSKILSLFHRKSIQLGQILPEFGQGRFRVGVAWIAGHQSQDVIEILKGWKRGSILVGEGASAGRNIS